MFRLSSDLIFLLQSYIFLQEKKIFRPFKAGRTTGKTSNGNCSRRLPDIHFNEKISCGKISEAFVDQRSKDCSTVKILENWKRVTKKPKTFEWIENYSLSDTKLKKLIRNPANPDF